jgi:hypothetical protein
MRKGEPTAGLDFYKLLCSDDEFCKELGRAVLAAGRLESGLKRFLDRHAAEAETAKATLGRLIGFAEQRNLLTKLVPALKTLRDQRNCLTHNIHALFSGLIEETILEGDGLLDSDVDLFTERASQLKANLDGLAGILEKNA